MTMITGRGGSGKTQSVARIVASASTGKPLPDGAAPSEVGYSLYVGAEDGMRETLTPRLLAAGADMSRIRFLNPQAVHRAADGTPQVSMKCLQDLAYWEGVFIKYRPVILVFDPLTSYLGDGIDDHKNSEVRRVVTVFLRLAEKYNVAIIAVSHHAKAAEGRYSVDQVIGSVAYSALSRVVYQVFPDPDDPDRLHFCQTKNNLAKRAPSLAYRIVDASVTGSKSMIPIATSRVEFEAGPSGFDPDRKGDKKTSGPEPAKTMEAARWLLNLLKDVPRPVAWTDIDDRAGRDNLIGEIGKDGRWTNRDLLRAARVKVALLPHPYDGWIAEEHPLGGRGNPKGVMVRRVG
jgi:putative DNA primase/helicase